MAKTITPETFLQRMEEIDKYFDMEGAHCAADGLMCEVLISLGYGEGIEIYQKMHKWYA